MRLAQIKIEFPVAAGDGKDRYDKRKTAQIRNQRF
jgi:tmRNA-binding protein